MRSLVALLVFALLVSVHPAVASRIVLDFDNDGDPSTIRTVCPFDEGGDSVLVKLVLQVDQVLPAGGWEIFVAAGCCDSVGHARLGVELSLPQVYPEFLSGGACQISIPQAGPDCAHNGRYAFGCQFSDLSLLPPDSSHFMGEIWCQVHCQEQYCSPPPPEIWPPTEFSFAVSGDNLETANGIMSLECCGPSPERPTTWGRMKTLFQWR